MTNKKIKILAIPGSLREQSSSHIVMRAMAQWVPDGIVVEFFNDLAQLPHFDDSSVAPSPIMHFRNKLKEADGILICTPEYAFGVPGSLKNALDWTVSSGELVNKPVALVTASSSGEKGHAAMLLILSALSAQVNPEATALISFVRTKVKDGQVTDVDVVKKLQHVLSTLVAMIRASIKSN